MSQILTEIKNRRSIRKYQNDVEIPQQNIDLMLEAAMLAPSAGNSRPWEFVVVRDQEIMQEMTKISPYTKPVPGASLAIVVCGRPDLQSGMLEGYWPQDCGAAIENLLLQAQTLGYGTVWCGIYPIEERVAGLQKLLDISSIPVGVVAVGLADENPDIRGFYDKDRVKYL